MENNLIFKRSSRSQGGFTIISNDLINDLEISIPAKFMMILLLSKPDTWNINITHLCNNLLKTKNTVYGYLKELEKIGYIEKQSQRQENGKFDKTIYMLFEQKQTPKPPSNKPPSPCTKKPCTAKRELDKPDTANCDLSNTQNNKTDLNNTQISKTEKPVIKSSSLFELSVLENLKPDSEKINKKSEEEIILSSGHPPKDIAVLSVPNIEKIKSDVKNLSPEQREIYGMIKACEKRNNFPEPINHNKVMDICKQIPLSKVNESVNGFEGLLSSGKDIYNPGPYLLKMIFSKPKEKVIEYNQHPVKIDNDEKEFYEFFATPKMNKDGVFNKQIFTWAVYPSSSRKSDKDFEISKHICKSYQAFKNTNDPVDKDVFYTFIHELKKLSAVAKIEALLTNFVGQPMPTGMRKYANEENIKGFMDIFGREGVKHG